MIQSHPRGELPIMTDGDATIHEESAMLLYIENFYHEPSLLGAPTIENRCEYSQQLGLFHESIGSWANMARSILSVLVQDKVDKKLLKEKLKEWKTTLDIELTRWEKLLMMNSHSGNGNGEFLGGRSIMLVDVAFFPYLAQLVRYGLDLTPYPNLRRYYGMMEQRPSVIKTWPSGWTTTTVEKYLVDLRKK